MNYRLKAYGGSLLLHLLLLLVIIYISRVSFQADTKRPLEIDLSFVELEGKTEKVKAPERAFVPRAKQPREEKRTSLETSRPSPAVRQLQPSDRHTSTEEVKPAGERTESFTIGQSDSDALPAAPSKTSTGQTATPDAVETKSGTGKTESQPQALTSPQQQRELYLKEKLHVISQIVQKNISYPPIARRMGWEGRVVLIIRLCEDGTLKEVRVAESSGYEILDRNAVETVRKVAHLFPKPPVEVVVRLPVSYRLE